MDNLFDELNGKKEINKASPLDNLKSRMLSSPDDTNPKTDSHSPFGFSVTISEEEQTEQSEQSAEKPNISVFSTGDKAEQDNSKEQVASKLDTEKAEDVKEAAPKKHRLSFLRRMRPYTTDDNGVDVSKQEKPLYELDSVDSILGLEQKDASATNEPEEKPQYKFDLDKTAEPEPEKVDYEAENGNNGNNNSNAEIDEKSHYISDIDKAEDETGYYKPASTNTETIRFTPVTDTVTEKPSVSVDTMTHRLDLGAEITDRTPSESTASESFEETDFQKYAPENEIKDTKDEKRRLHDFAVKKRNRFLTTAASGMISLALLVFLLPQITGSMSGKYNGLFIAAVVLLGVVVLLNADMFLSFAKIKSRKLGSDISAAFATLSTLMLAIFSIIKGENTFPVVFICAFTIFMRSLTEYYNISDMLGNLRVIAVRRKKKAVTLIDNPNSASVMAKNSIEGDVLIATSSKTDRVTDFIKYSSYDTKLYGKTGLITVISLTLAIICGITAGFMKHSIVEAFFVSSLILLLTSLPTVFFVNALPLRTVTSKLNRKGAMLNGFYAAEQLNTANAVVLNSADLFPSGTVTLKSIKILSDNNVDDIILRAASLTDALSSPLSPIFKRIAKTNAAYDVPASDTVKYEERLGISGWVENERLFVGNRTLMEAHGIEVPPLEIDREILKSGYFPVYVSKDSKACVLLIVKYSADPTVAKLLRDTTALGITVLFNNSDPNITDEMICDYFGIYENMVHIMSTVGSSVNKAATEPASEVSSGASYKGNSLSLLNIMISASKLKLSNTILAVCYCIAAIIGIIYFVYNSFLSGTAVIERASTLLIYEIASTAVSLLAFLIKLP